MDSLTSRQLRYYVKLSYPVRVTGTANGYKGVYPDLPGCEARDPDIVTLYQKLDQRRHKWLHEHLLAGAPIPLPNAYLDPCQSYPRSLEQLGEERDLADQEN